MDILATGDEWGGYTAASREAFDLPPGRYPMTSSSDPGCQHDLPIDFPYQILNHKVKSLRMWQTIGMHRGSCI